MNPLVAIAALVVGYFAFKALPSGKAQPLAPGWPPIGYDGADWFNTGLHSYRPKTYGDENALPIAFLVVARKNGGSDWQVVGPRQPISTETKADKLMDAWVAAHPDDNTAVLGLLRREFDTQADAHAVRRWSDAHKAESWSYEKLVTALANDPKFSSWSRDRLDSAIEEDADMA